jgi:hypothetical protein
VLGKDVLTRLRDYVIAHIDEPIEVSTLEDSILPGCSPDSLASVRTATSCICDGNEWSSLFVMSGLADVAVRTGFADQAISRVGSGASTAFPRRN